MGKKQVARSALRRTSAATRSSRLVLPLPRGPMTIWCWFESPVHALSDSISDSNSCVRTQNDATSSSSVRNPGLYFRTVAAVMA